MSHIITEDIYERGILYSVRRFKGREITDDIKIQLALGTFKWPNTNSSYVVYTLVE